mgnify:CR=1 FL=1
MPLAHITPATPTRPLAPVDVLERGPLQNGWGEALVPCLARNIATRELEALEFVNAVGVLRAITTLALRRFVRAHSLVSDLPIATSLRGFAAVGLQGDREDVRGLARAVITQA